MDRDRPSILEGLEIGSVVFGETRRIGATVLKPGITAINPKIQKTKDVVKSNSQYVHNAGLTEKSLSITGGYGVSGVVQIEAGFSAAVSEATSDTSHEMSISMQRFVTSGIEYIDFNNLSPADFIAALKGAPTDPDSDTAPSGTYARMLRVLDAYQAMHAEAGGHDVADLIGSTALADWITARDAFLRAEGELLVIGIVWGGWGGVKLSFEAVTAEDLMKKGGAGKFSVAGTGFSGSVEASYGNSELTEDQKRSGRVDRISNGKAVEALVDKWEATLTSILTENINSIGKTTVNDLGSAPIPSLPKRPDTVKPKGKPGIAKKIDGIKDLAGLEAFAKASAYDAYVKKQEKAGEDAMSLDDFLKQAREPNDVSGTNDTPDAIEPDTDAPHLRAMPPQPESTPPGLLGAKASAKADDDTFADFVAVGAWMVPWGQIFPWLAEPQFNAIPKGAFRSSTFRLRMFASDIATLARRYRHLDVMGVRIPKLDLYPDEIANAFQKAHARAQDLLTEQLSVPGGKYDDADLDTRMKTVLATLAPTYRRIYMTWIGTPQLRDCELGAGIEIAFEDMDNGHHNITLTSAKKQFIYQDQGFWSFETERSSFDAGVKNYEFFAKMVKVIPTVLPNGQIAAFVAWIDEKEAPIAGLLCANRDNPAGLVLSHINVEGTELDSFHITEEFHVVTFGSTSGKGFSGRTYGPVPRGYSSTTITLTPLPFTAARNVDWRGASNTVGISDMQAHLHAMRDRLAELTQWSFGSEYWAARDPSEPLLSLQALEPFYVGLAEEPSLFKKSHG